MQGSYHHLEFFLKKVFPFASGILCRYQTGESQIFDSIEMKLWILSSAKGPPPLVTEKGERRRALCGSPGPGHFVPADLAAWWAGLDQRPGVRARVLLAHSAES